MSADHQPADEDEIYEDAWTVEAVDNWAADRSGPSAALVAQMRSAERLIGERLSGRRR